jgi:hypothetical protein
MDKHKYGRFLNDLISKIQQRGQVVSNGLVKNEKVTENS